MRSGSTVARACGPDASVREQAGEVLDVWCIDVEAVAGAEPRLCELLDDEERDRAGRFVRPGDARRYRIAHGALRAILSRHTGVAAGRLRFARGEHGKPQLRDGGPHFSLSHSGGVVLVAVSADRPVGVDVELVRSIPQAGALARRFFSPEDARALGGRPSSGRDRRFMRSWTAMEAVLKAEGTGLADGRATLGIRAATSGLGHVTVAGARDGPSWSVRWFVPAPAHVGAVAARGDGVALRVRRFE